MVKGVDEEPHYGRERVFFIEFDQLRERTGEELTPQNPCVVHFEELVNLHDGSHYESDELVGQLTVVLRERNLNNKRRM